MHEAGYAALGLPFTYVPFEVDDLGACLAGMRGLGIRGLGVSHPFKQQVMPMLDEVDGVAERIGAVNTIVNLGRGRLAGHNTDWVGAVRALEEVTALRGARVLLLGAGGAARAVAFGLRERLAEVTIANRDRAKGEAVAAETGAHAAPFSERGRAAAYDVVVNATTIGQKDQGASGDSPLAADALREGLVVMDIVFKPIQTPLLEMASRRGSVAVHGGRMLLHQAAAQFELYTGHRAPLDAMDRALRATLGAS
jgi:shikimate dehydrogenase